MRYSLPINWESGERFDQIDQFDRIETMRKQIKTRFPCSFVEFVLTKITGDNNETPPNRKKFRCRGV
jgi:hypothetical protein